MTMVPEAPGAPYVVVVDDDDAVVSSLRFALGTEDIAVRGYGTAAALLAAVEPERTCCLVIDFRLPDLDGLELLAILRQAGVSAPAIFITTNPSRALRLRVEAAGALLVEKPLLGTALADAIHDSVLRWAPGEPPAGRAPGTDSHA